MQFSYVASSVKVQDFDAAPDSILLYHYHITEEQQVSVVFVHQALLSRV